MNEGARRYIPPLDDGLAWAVAAIVLLAAVFLAAAPVPIAVVVSLAAYAGLALARVKDKPPAVSLLGATDEDSYQIARSKIARLRELRNGISDQDVRAWIDGYQRQAGAILAVIEEDRKLRAAPLFLQGNVLPSEELLQEYARLERRNVQAAKPILERIKRENLPLIRRATDDFYEQLHQIDVIEIDTLSERLEYNLTDRLPAIGRSER